MVEELFTKDHEVDPMVVTEIEVKPCPPIPNNGEPDQHADQGSNCKKGFRVSFRLGILFHRKSKNNRKIDIGLARTILCADCFENVVTNV